MNPSQYSFCHNTVPRNMPSHSTIGENKPNRIVNEVTLQKFMSVEIVATIAGLGAFPKDPIECLQTTFDEVLDILRDGADSVQ
jgi:hypothetical protein